MKPKTKAKPKKASKPKNKNVEVQKNSDKPLTAKEQKDVLEMVRKIAAREVPGFVVATILNPDDTAKSRMFGNRVSKSIIIQTVFGHVDVDPMDAMMTAMAVKGAR